ncbi:MAG: carboxypeptidase regulatory-like domain-containing protein [Pyrinomonadaceae bacterium]
MKLKTISVCALILLLAVVCAGQKKSKPVPTTGGVKGKVRVDSGATPEGVRVSLRRDDDEEVAHAETSRDGGFEIAGVAPGVYTLTFRKTGLKTAELKPYEIRAGKTNSLGDHVFMPVDEGSIAFVRGSVFTATGASVEGARVELFMVGADGSVKKIDGRVSNESGQFSFRLKPSAGHYRVTAKGEGGEATKDVDVEGALVYRVALSLKPSQ